VDRQLQHYFLGVVSFGAVAVWATAGLLTAALALFVCAVVVHGSRLLSRRGTQRPHRAGHRQRPLRTRPLRDEAEGLPLVPDDPSLIIELG
jgi:hypothetical protein